MATIYVYKGVAKCDTLIVIQDMVIIMEFYKDESKILRYQNGSRAANCHHVDEEDKTDGVTIRDSIGREPILVLNCESGLYWLILYKDRIWT